MEKFGIFELLDTLSALIGAETPNGAERNSADPEDASFAPPTYGAPQPSVQDGPSSALSSFLARHDAAAKRLGGKKP